MQQETPATAREFQRRGRYAEAIPIWQRLIARGKGNVASYAMHLARCLLALKQPTQACHALAPFQDSHREDESYRDLRIRALAANGEGALLQQEAQQRLSTNPGDLQAQIDLAGIHEAEGRPEEAAESLPTNPREALLGLQIRYRTALQLARDGNRSLADALLFTHLDRKTLAPEIVYRQALLRTKLGNIGSETNELLDFLILQSPQVSGKSFLLKLDFQWEFGASAKELLAQLRDYESQRQLPSGGDLDELRIALLLEAGELDELDKLLTHAPAHALYYDRVLPLASYLVERNPPLEAAQAYANLNKTLCDQFDHRMQDRFSCSKTIAVVGNSGCEIGKGRGPEIDAHDEVIRFNQFSLSETYRPDYGQRTTIIARVPTALNPEPQVISGQSVIFSGRNFRYRWRDWELPLRYLGNGASIFAIPVEVHSQLIPNLGASPSSGLALAALLKQVRASLNPRDFYGFAFVDQIGENASSAHYFEKAKAIHRHHWERELQLFDTFFK